MEEIKFLLICIAIYYTYKLVYKLTRKALFPGTTAGFVYHKIDAVERKNIPFVLEQLLNPQFVDDNIALSYFHQAACGCLYPIGGVKEMEGSLTNYLKKKEGQNLRDVLGRIIRTSRHLPADKTYITINDALELLKNIIKNYEGIDENMSASIVIVISFKLKKIREIDNGTKAKLINSIHHPSRKKEIKKLLLSNSSRSLGHGTISYPLIGEKSVAFERKMMVTFPPSAKYNSQPTSNTFSIKYDGYVCALKYLLDEVNNIVSKDKRNGVNKKVLETQ